MLTREQPGKVRSMTQEVFDVTLAAGSWGAGRPGKEQTSGLG